MCPGWPPMAQTSVLLISASQVARITGMSHQHPPGRNWTFEYRKFDTEELVMMLIIDCAL
jgi:hypothetical protein